MLAGLVMHIFEDALIGLVVLRTTSMEAKRHVACSEQECAVAVENPNDSAIAPSKALSIQDADDAAAPQKPIETDSATGTGSFPSPTEQPETSETSPMAHPGGTTVAACAPKQQDILEAVLHVHAHPVEHEHTDKSGKESHLHFVVAALLMEFGVTVHSVLIGECGA
jgi:hypothetical protein